MHLAHAVTHSYQIEGHEEVGREQRGIRLRRYFAGRLLHTPIKGQRRMLMCSWQRACACVIMFVLALVLVLYDYHITVAY